MLMAIACAAVVLLLLLLVSGIPKAKQRTPVKALILLCGGFLLYEGYMDLIWEKTVHAPIRLDLLFLLPLMAMATVGGAVWYVWRGRSDD